MSQRQFLKTLLKILKELKKWLRALRKEEINFNGMDFIASIETLIKQIEQIIKEEQGDLSKDDLLIIKR